ncbi:MAG: sulfite exporter TauE/SafE family protein [Eggerthellaceae bacterium]
METFIVAALIGVIIGVFSGLLGIGGGTLMVPIFRLGFGMSAIASTATSLFTIIPTSLGGFITHIRNKTCIPKVGLVCGLAGACTSPLGVYLASISPSWSIMLAAALIIGYSSVTMFRKAIRMPKIPSQGTSAVVGVDRERAVEQAASKAASEEGPFTFTPKKVGMCICIGFVAGLASGYVGVGGGFIMVPMFISLLGVMMRQASGTSLVAVTILAIPGVIEQGLLGNINYTAGIAMAIGSIPGAILGANLIRRVPESKLRFVFGAFLLLSAVVLLLNEFLPLFL